jgi:CDP-diacylglycerol--inositol 3-phosphatidyltransferase
MYAAASLKVHHKSAESNANRFFLVRYYYDCYPFFGYCCVSAEITYVVMYVLKHTIVETSRSFFISSMRLLLVVCIPGCAIKQIVNFFQLFSSCNAVALDDAKRKTQ